MTIKTIKDYISKPENRKFIDSHMDYSWLRKYNAEEPLEISVPPQGNPAGIIGVGLNFAMHFMIAKEYKERVNMDVAHDWIIDDIVNSNTNNDFNRRVVKKAHMLFDNFVSGAEVDFSKVAIAVQYLAYIEGQHRYWGHHAHDNGFMYSEDTKREIMEMVNTIEIKDLLEDIPGEILLGPKINFSGLLDDKFSDNVDLVVGRTLIDIKATKNYKLTTPDLRLLACQSAVISHLGLKGVDNETGIENIGFFHARYGALSTISLNEFVKDMSDFTRKFITKMEEDVESTLFKNNKFEY